MKNSEIRWTISKKRLEIVYHETTIIAPHLFRYLCVIWIFFTSTRSKKLSSITDLLIQSSFTSLLAMDSGNSNGSPEHILSSGGNMRIFVRGNPDSFKENVSWQQESLSLFWSSHWFAYMSSKLQFHTQMPRWGRVEMILDCFDPNKQTDKKCTRSAGR